MSSIENFKEHFKLSQYPLQKVMTDVREKENAMYALMRYLEKYSFGYDVGINHNPEHVYAPFPSVIVYNLDVITKDWAHAVHIDDNGGLVITKLTPSYTQKNFISAVVEDHKQDERDSNGW